MVSRLPGKKVGEIILIDKLIVRCTVLYLLKYIFVILNLVHVTSQRQECADFLIKL